MSDSPESDIEARLTAAFDARARDAVGDHEIAPEARFAAPRSAGRRGRILAPLAAAAAVAATVGIVFAVAHSTDGRHPAATPPSTAAAAADPVHISLLNADGDKYGVGMPVIAYFSRAITDARALQKATTVTVDGRPLETAWYFEHSKAGKGPIEGHLRPRTYWPAHSEVRVSVAAKGVSGGDSTTFDDNISLDFATGAKNIAVVDDHSHDLTVTSDGKRLYSFRVSLGAKASPTLSGTKVIMEKGAKICMKGTGYDECGIKYTQRLTYGGEFLHAAPWNAVHIAKGVDSSNGCTNLMPGNAEQLYSLLRIGDVVQYPNTDGAKMTLGEGYGDWNVNWGTWLTGGAVPTR